MSHTILSVGDDAAVCGARNEVFRRAGFELIEARTGTDALELALEKQPALVVLATELPGMDCFAILERLKSAPRTASIPVLYLSGRGELNRDHAEPLQSGADAHLQLPVEPAVLIAVVTALIQAGSGGSERRRAEAALRAREERFRLALDAAGIGTFEYYLATGESSWDRRAKAVWGLPPDAQIAYPQLLERIHPEDRTRIRKSLEEAARTESQELSGAEYRVIWPDGEVHWILGASRTFFEGDGEQRHAARMIGFHRDITESKQAEQALRASEERLRLFVDHAPVAIAMLDRQMRYAAVSRRWMADYALGEQDLIGRSHYDVFPEIPERWKEIHRRCLAGAVEKCDEDPFPRANGDLDWIRWEIHPWHNAKGDIGGIIIFTELITGRKRAEEALRESEERFRALVMASSDAVYRMNPDWSEMRQLRGRDFIADTEAPSRAWLQRYIHPDDQPRVMAAIGEAIQAKSNFELEHRVLRADGTLGWTFSRAVPLRDANGEVVEWLGAASDITERKHAEARLREAQKLESLGLLAGGVAHDFNNLLVGVIGNASLAQELLPPDHAAAELLDGVIRTGQQAAHLTRQMLAYSGKGKFVVEALSLSALIPEMVGLVRPSISKKIALHLDLDDDLPPVEADRGQLQQVFMNLALNAAEAIGSHDGLITIKTGVQQVDDKYTRLHPEAAALTPGRYVCLEVRDTGCGMDDATKARIFDPFFSTKFTGRGLGLAAVAGILRGHKGAISVATAPGKGSCFTVLFPAAARAAEERPAAAGLAAAKGSGTILVVDDEKLVRDMVRRALERYGYTVLLADGGPSAIDLLKRHPSDIALVVLDLSMPRMSGEEALPELRRIRPEIKVLVSSGYSESETMTLFKGQRVSGFIQKPYTGAVLAEKVKICLG